MKKLKTSGVVLHELLTSLSCKTDWMILGFTNPYEYRNAMSGWMPREEWDRIFEKQKKKAALTRLRKKNWVSNRIQGERVIFQLSFDALVTILKEQIILSDKRLRGNKHALVIFDFPEVAKKARTAFRTFLKEAGFLQKQLSVWISDKDAVHQMKSLIQLLNLEKWAEVYTVEI
ncbi:MAG: hypothetical protein WC654_04135 [Patescibacteria group bacterium]